MQGPFTLQLGPVMARGGRGWYTIYDAKGVRIVDLSGCLIDGSGGHKDNDGYIVRPEERQQHAEWVLKAMNNAWMAADAWEIRADGKPVRKDRWQWGMRRIAALLWGNRHAFEIDDVVEAVRRLIKNPDNDAEGLCRAAQNSAWATKEPA